VSNKLSRSANTLTSTNNSWRWRKSGLRRRSVKNGGASP